MLNGIYGFGAGLFYAYSEGQATANKQDTLEPNCLSLAGSLSPPHSLSVQLRLKPTSKQSLTEFRLTDDLAALPNTYILSPTPKTAHRSTLRQPIMGLTPKLQQSGPLTYTMSHAHQSPARKSPSTPKP